MSASISSVVIDQLSSPDVIVALPRSALGVMAIGRMKCLPEIAHRTVSSAGASRATPPSASPRSSESGAFF